MITSYAKSESYSLRTTVVLENHSAYEKTRAPILVKTTLNMNKYLSVISFILIKILINLIGIIRAKVIAVVWGKAMVGVLGQLLAFYQLQNTALKVGTSATLINYINHDDESVRHAAVQSILLIIATGNLLFLIVTLTSAKTIAFYLFKSSEYTGFVYWIIWLGPLFSLFWLLQTLNQGEKNFKVLIRAQLVSLLVALITIGPLAYYWGIAGVIVNLVIWYSISAVLMSNQRLNTFIFRRQDFHLIKSLFPTILRDSLTLFITNILMFCALLIFRILAVQMLDLNQAGLLQSVWSISNYIQMIVQGFVFYLFPEMSSIKNKLDFNRALNANLQLLFYVLMPILVVLTSFPTFLLELLYSKEFSEAAGWLGWMFFGRLFEAMFIFYSIVLLSQNLLKQFLYLELFRSTLLVFLPTILVSKFALTGGIAGIVIVYILSSIAIAIIAHREIGSGLQSKTIRMFVVFAISILMIIHIPQPWPYAPAIGLVIGSLGLVLALDLKKYVDLYWLLRNRFNAK